MSEWTEYLKKQQERVKWVIKGIHVDDISEWEQKFLESIEKQSMGCKWLSDRQMEILEKIYREKGK